MDNKKDNELDEIVKIFEDKSTDFKKFDLNFNSLKYKHYLKYPFCYPMPSATLSTMKLRLYKPKGRVPSGDISVDDVNMGFYRHDCVHDKEKNKFIIYGHDSRSLSHITLVIYQ